MYRSKLMTNAIRSLLALTIVIGGAAARAEAAPILVLTPGTTMAAVNDQLEVTVAIQGVTGLFGFDIEVLISDAAAIGLRSTDLDPADLDSDPTAPGSFLSDGGANTTFYFDEVAAVGTVRAVSTVIGCCGVDGTGALFTLLLRANAVGSGTLSFGTVELIDADGLAISGAELGTASITVAGAASMPIPEPGTLVLLGTGALASMLCRRLRRRGVRS